MNKNIKIIGIITIIAFFSITCNLDTDHSETTKWVSFQSKEGRFKIEFPHKPDEGTKVKRIRQGDVTLYYFSYHYSSYKAADNDCNDSNLLYYVSYYDIPLMGQAMTNNTEVLFQLLKENTDSMVSFVHGKLEYITRESINNYPEMESGITFKLNDVQVACRQKCFFIKNRLYHILVDTAPKKTFNKSVAHFFSTFEPQP